MSSTYDNNKRIAKNTLMLYFRMILLMLVTLYTSRVVLNALGVEDYGIYNVVGGVVTMFSIISGSLSSAISRFITFELGKGDMTKLKKVFSTSINIQIGISIVFVLLAESIGLWFLNTQMNIPDGRMHAANWVLHLSVATFVINLISVPYNAAIVAHEHMSTFAYVGIFEAVSRLAVALFLVHSPADRLIFFAAMLVVIGFIVRLIYGIYCKRHFEECSYRFIFDRSLMKEMTSFAGWNFMGSTAYLLNTQGVNMLLNIFFGVTINAARGIAVRVDAAVRQLINNFTTAVNPQITKYYASGDREEMQRLMFRSARFSSYLFFIFAIPIGLEAPFILEIWLKNPPEYAAVFAQLTLIGTFVDNILANCMVTAMLATGDIKKYQIYVSSFGVSVFLLSWVAFAIGLPPEATYVIWIIVYALLLYVRLVMLKGLIKLSPKRYMKEVLYRVIPVLALSLLLPLIVRLSMPQSYLRLALVCILSIPISLTIAYLIGITANERKFIREKTLNKVLSKIKK